MFSSLILRRTTIFLLIAIPWANRPDACAQSPEPVWEAALGEPASTPAISALGSIAVVTSSGSLHTFDRAGRQRWSVPPETSPVASESAALAPAIGADGALYYCTPDGYARSVDALGRRRWRVRTAGLATGTPALMPDDTAIIGTDAGWLYAIDVRGSVTWETKLEGQLRGAPAIDGIGNIYIAASAGRFHAVKPNGNLKWTASAGNGTEITSSPALGADGAICFGAADGSLHAFNPVGTLRWQFSAGAPVAASPVIGVDGRVYFGTSAGVFHCLEPDGRPAWNHQGTSAIADSAGLTHGGTAYFGRNTGNFAALRYGGVSLWKSTSVSARWSAPAFDGALAFVTTAEGSLLAFATPAPPDAGAWPSFHADQQRTGRVGTGLTDPPDLIFIAPANGAVLYLPAEITLTIDADDRDGLVRKVEFFANDQKLGEQTAPPFLFRWTNATAGRYTVRAIATDDRGAASAVAHSVDVREATDPIALSLYAPLARQRFAPGTPIALQPSITGGASSIRRLEFWAGDKQIAESSLAPYTVSWMNAPVGEHQLSIRAIGLDDRVTSPPVLISVGHFPIEVCVLGDPEDAREPMSRLRAGGWIFTQIDPQQPIEASVLTNTKVALVAVEARSGVTPPLGEQVRTISAAGIPIYFIGDGIFVPGKDMSTALMNEWLPLTGAAGLIRSASTNGVEFHRESPLLMGPAGPVSTFSYPLPMPSLPVAIRAEHQVTAVAGAQPVIWSATGAPGIALRSVTQALNLPGPDQPAAATELGKLFENALTWLITTGGCSLANLSVHSLTAPSLIVGESSSFAFSIQNSGECDADDARLVFSWNGPLEFVAAESATGFWTLHPDRVGFFLGRMPSGARETVRILLRASAPGAGAGGAWARASAGDPDWENNRLHLPLELRAGTQPHLRISLGPNRVPQIETSAATGETLTILSSIDLRRWNVRTNLAPVNSPVHWIDPAPGPQQFYRVVRP